jgi:hypothetical protein
LGVGCRACFNLATIIATSSLLNDLSDGFDFRTICAIVI